jgi:hypothetical protein
MASTYTPLGVELQATGENAGTWGTKTNTNLSIIEQISGGFIEKSIAGGAQTTALTVNDGSVGAELAHRMIEFTGSITGNQIVTIPLDVQTFYFLRNSTSGAYTVQFKYASGSGASFTFSATDKGDKIVFASASDGTNPIIKEIATGITSVVADTSPQLGGNLDTNSHNIDIDDAHGIRDENGNEQIIFQTTSSAVNQFDVTNAATGNPPKISSTGGDSNIDLDLEAKGTGHLTVRGNTNPGAIQLNCESNSHGQQIKSQPHSASVTNVMLLPAGADSTLVSLVSTDTLTNKTLTAPKIADAGFIADANGAEQIIFQTTASAVNELEVTNAATGNNPAIAASGGDTNVGLALKTKGTGVIQAEDSGGNVSAVKIAGKETIWIPAVAMYPNSTNGCADLDQTELSNGPEIKTLDFDKDSDEFAQFAVAFPKSWNEGTVTFQAFFTANSTNTGTVSWGLSGVAIADNDSCNTAFGTQVAPTAKAHSGTANDLDATAESGAVTIAGSPSTDEQVFFQISRDVSEDSLTADAKLLGIKLFFTTDAANDL